MMRVVFVGAGWLLRKLFVQQGNAKRCSCTLADEFFLHSPASSRIAHARLPEFARSGSGSDGAIHSERALGRCRRHFTALSRPVAVRLLQITR